MMPVSLSGDIDPRNLDFGCNICLLKVNSTTDVIDSRVSLERLDI